MIGAESRWARPERATLLAYDANLRRAWRQDTWVSGEYDEVALAPLAEGRVALAASICDSAGCRLLVTAVAPGGRVDWAILGDAVASDNDSEVGSLRMSGVGSGLWIAHLGPGERGSAEFALTLFATSGLQTWSAGLPFERPLDLFWSSGLAVVDEGSVALSAMASYEPLLLRVGADGTVEAKVELPTRISTVALRSLPGGGAVSAGTASRDPAPADRSEDLVVARHGPALDEVWRGYAKGPGSRFDQAQGLALGIDRVCLSGASSWPGASWESATQAVCWDLDGDLLWSRVVAGPTPESHASAVALSSAGDLAVASAPYAAGGLDLTVFDEAGRSKWERRTDSPFDGLGSVDLQGMGFISTGDLIVAARARQNSNATGVFAFDSSGGQRWLWDPIAVAWGPLTSGFAVSGDRALVAGCYQQWIGGAAEPFVAALDPAGRLLWLTSLPGPADCYWQRLAVDACGRALVATRMVGDRVEISSLSPEGAVLWRDTIPHSGTLLPWEIATDGAGSIWVELQQWGALDSVFLARYHSECPITP